MSTRSAFPFLYMVRVYLCLHGHSLCLLDHYCNFKFNVPSASHMGGVWERQVRTVRSVLVPMLEKSGSQLDDESLRMLLSEGMCIVNSRPLSVNDLYDPSSKEPMTPNHILTMKTKIVLSLRESSRKLMCILGKDGKEFNICLMCSGADGKISTYKHCKCEVNGTRTLVRFPRAI